MSRRYAGAGQTRRKGRRSSRAGPPGGGGGGAGTLAGQATTSNIAHCWAMEDQIISASDVTGWTDTGPNGDNLTSDPGNEMIAGTRDGLSTVENTLWSSAKFLYNSSLSGTLDVGSHPVIYLVGYVDAARSILCEYINTSVGDGIGHYVAADGDWSSRMDLVAAPGSSSVNVAQTTPVGPKLWRLWDTDDGVDSVTQLAVATDADTWSILGTGGAGASGDGLALQMTSFRLGGLHVAEYGDIAIVDVITLLAHSVADDAAIRSWLWTQRGLS